MKGVKYILEHGNFCYYLNEKREACIENYLGSDSELRIPETLDGHAVTQIVMRAFKNEKKIKTLYIPATVEKISDEAFVDCINLEEIIVDKNNNYYCDVDGILYSRNKQVQVRIPAKYRKGPVLTEPREVVKMENHVMESNTTISKKIMSDYVTKIGHCAFNNSKLNQISISRNVKRIDFCTFTGCKNLEEVEIRGNKLEEIQMGAFAGCGALKTINIPDSCRIIGHQAFAGCRSLGSLQLPGNLECLGDMSFSGCRSLRELIIPDSCDAIEKSAFRGCFSLRKITLPKSLEILDEWVFKGCKALKIIEIPDGVEEINDNAFDGCDSLKLITIPDSVLSIKVWENHINLKKTIIKCNPGSYAEEWAKAYGIRTRPIASALDKLLESADCSE